MAGKIFLSLTTVLLLAASAVTPLFSEEWYDPTEYSRELVFSVQPVFILPVDKFSDIYDFGYGMTAEIGPGPSDITSLKFFFRTGFIFLEPADESDFGSTGTGNSYMIPMMLGCGYRFHPFRSWKFEPSLSAGVSLNRATYDDRSGTISGGVPTGYTADEDKTEMSLEPVSEAGLKIIYMLGTSDSLFISSGFTAIAESEEFFYFASAGFGYERRF